jgi:hypothetical protein
MFSRVDKVCYNINKIKIYVHKWISERGEWTIRVLKRFSRYF